jgi:hemolysin activation/secretion protein
MLFFIRLLVVGSLFVTSLQAQSDENQPYSFEILGNKTVSEAELQQELTKFQTASLTVELLKEIETAVFNVYVQRGIIATVKIPPQDLENNLIKINVYETRLGQITLDAPTDLGFNQDRIVAMVKKQLSDQPVLTVQNLEATAKNIDALEGINAKIVLEKGSQLGFPTTKVRLTDAPLLNVKLQLDNYGSEAVGERRDNVDVQFNGLFDLGERIALGSVSTDGSQLDSLDVDLPWGNAGSILSYGVRASEYEVTDFDVPLGLFEGFRGDSRSTYATYTLPEYRYGNILMTSALNYSLTKALDYLNFTILSQNSGDKKIANLSLIQTLTYDNPAEALAVNATVSITRGKTAYFNPNNQLSDSLSIEAAGHFNKVNADIGLQKGLPNSAVFSILLSAQIATKNLDRTQEKILTGPTAVRAYPVGLVSADEALVLKIDWNQVINERIAVFLFQDFAWGQTHDNTWENWNTPNFEPNNFSLMGAGLGINASLTSWLTMNIQASKPLGKCKVCAINTDESQVWAVLTGTY